MCSGQSDGPEDGITRQEGLSTIEVTLKTKEEEKESVMEAALKAKIQATASKTKYKFQPKGPSRPRPRPPSEPSPFPGAWACLGRSQPGGGCALCVGARAKALCVPWRVIPRWQVSSIAPGR